MTAADPNADIVDAAPPRRRGRRLLLLLVGVLVIAGGAGGALYALGFVGGHAASAGEPVADGRPQLVPKSEQKRIAAGGDGEGEAAAADERPQPGAERYASTYYAFDKPFTANVSDSDRLIQVGLAVSTHYDDTVIGNIRTNEIAVRSAVLLALGGASEDELSSEQGKRALQARLADAINRTLKQKEGFGGVGNVYFTTFVVQ